MTRRSAARLMVQGCTSSAGKSYLVAGLCRLLTNQGLRVAPFKAQNMSNNAGVTADGGEIGRAQVVQAVACRRPADVRMNLVLLKPEADARAQVVVRGVARHDLDDVAWHERKAHVWPVVADSLRSLIREVDVVIIEGAGSPAEILDVDYHHGNGTQEIFYDRDDVQYVSLHGDPARAYPYHTGFADEEGTGRGSGSNLNVPLPVRADDGAYLDALQRACQAITSFGPEVLIVSLGVDTFEADPIADLGVTTEGFGLQGALVAELGLLTVVLQEGGYNVKAIGANVWQFLNGERSEFETVFQNPDGTRSVALSSIPVHFKDGKGRWQKIDNRVAKDGRGVLVSGANEWQVVFEPMTSSGGVTVITPDGTVRFVAEGADREVLPVVEPGGESVRYVNVFPDTDLVYVVTGTGVEELLVLKSAGAVSSVSFVVHGAQFDRKEGELDARGDGVGRRLRVSFPESFDGQGRPIDLKHQRFESADRPGNTSTIVLGVTPEYLAGLPAEQFPVVVDPSIAVGLGASWLHSKARYSNTGALYGSYNDGYARIGNPYLSAGSTVRWRSTAFFDYSAYYWSSVVDASVTTTVVDGNGAGNRVFKVWWASQDDWHYGVTALRYPTTTPNSSAAVADWNQIYTSSTLGSGTATHGSGSPLRDLYNRWTRQGTAGGTLLLQGDETAAYTFKKFSITLTLTINWFPNVPTSTVTRNGSTFTFSGTSGTDADGDPLSFYQRVFNNTTGAWLDVAGSPSPATSGTVTVPASWSGHSLSAQVIAYDGLTWNGETHFRWSPNLLNYTNSPPAQPTLVSPATGINTHSFTQTLTANTVTDPNGDPVTYQFYWCTDAACTTKQLFSGTPTVTGGTVSQTVSFPSTFFGQEYWWGVHANDNWPAATASATRSFTVTNASPTATLVSPVNTALLTNQMPTLTAQVGDTDDLTVNYRFEVTPTNGTGILAASPWASIAQTGLGVPASVSFQVPDWLSSKTGYTWKVLVSDPNGATGTSASWTLSAQSRLGVDSASPMQQIGPVQVNLATGNVFVAAGSAKAVSTVGGPMSVGMTYNSHDLSGLGLRGTYYVDANNDNVPNPGEIKLVRTDSVPTFNWGTASPAESVPADGFKVQWKGTLRVPTAGDWLFAGGRDDNLKITITKNGGAPVVVYNSTCCAAIGDPNVFTGATAITLSPADQATIQIDYAEGGGLAYVEFRAKRTTTAESIVYADWFSTSTEQALPTGWTLSADTGLDPLWTRVEIAENELVATAVDGSQTVWFEDVRIVNGATVTSWIAPAETDDVVAVNTDGTSTISAADGLLYRFGIDGSLVDVTVAADTLKPAGAKRIYSPGTDPAATPRLTRIEDRVAPTRGITLRYNQAGLGPCPTAAGFDSAPPAGMLCEIVYPDNTSTRLYYSAGLLARISDPGDETSAAGAAPAPEGRSVTDLVWVNGQLTHVYTPSDNDRINAQNAPSSLIPVGERIPTSQLRTEITWTGGKPTVVTAPTPKVGQPRPAQTVGYLNSTTSTVTVAGIAGVSRTVTFDAAGRVLTDTDVVGRVTSTTWASGSDAVLKTTTGGRTTSTVYDSGWHPITAYGPAPSSCFTTTAPPVASQHSSYPPNGTCPNGMPQTVTAYDHNLQGLQGTHWSTNNFTQTPTGAGMGPNPSGHVDYTWPDPTAPAGVTNQDNWTARYTGLFTPSATGNYVFRLATGTNDTATLYLNDVAQLRTSAGTTDVSTGTVVLNSTAPIRVRIDLTAGTGTSSLKFGYGLNGATPGFAVGNTLKPGFWYATRITSIDTTGSSQLPAQMVTETRFDEGIDPVYGIATSSILDPAGAALKTLDGFETPGPGSLLRRTRRTLPAFAANPTSGNSTTYAYYPLSPAAGSAVANPCVAGSAAVDQGGQMQVRTEPAPATGSTVATETVYDILGRPVATRYVGETGWTCTSYDARGRTVGVSEPAFGALPARTITTTYQVNGDPYTTAVTDPAGTISTTIDAVGRTVRAVDVWGVTTITAYDQAGRVTTATTTITATGYSSTMGYTYDTASRLTQQTLDGLVVAVPAYSPDTDPVDPGKMISVTYPSGTGNGGNGTYGTLGYDTLGRPNSLTWQQSGTNTLITSDTVTRSLAGNVLTNTVDGALAWTYTYDAAGRLARAAGSGHDYLYGYVPGGGCGANPAAGLNTNRTSLTDNNVLIASYCYDNADRLTSTTQPGYTGSIGYDTHGNTTLLAGEMYTYDQANRHVGTVRAGVVTVGYQRDATDRIVSRTETPSGGAAATVRYGYTGPGDTSDLTLSTSNAVLERVVTLPGGASYTARGAGSVWSYPNLHGDNTAKTNNTGVKQGVTTFYDPFGNLIAGTLPDNVSGGLDNGWLGQHQRPVETAAGLQATIEMGARPYNPILGRFLGVDPVEGGTPNAYTYVDDPVNEFDLNGQWGLPKWVKKIAKAVTKVAEVVAFVPGPIGMVAAGVAVAGNLAQGNWKGAPIGVAGMAGGALLGKGLTTFAKRSPAVMSALKSAGTFQAKLPIIGVGSRLFGRGGQYGVKGLLNREPVRLGWNALNKSTATFRLAVGPAKSFHFDMMFSRWP